ncbi:MAG: SulP family inorganic anion transporter, partial [Rhodobacteraceae bacterium]|nr:SulP family inorganic anion transporter [Paracoccaceae bacterium]
MAIARLLQLLIACLVIGSMAVALTISFAALIYAGPLSAFLGQGIALTLLGGAVMALVGSFAYSIRGVICNPQDITAVLIGSAASGYAGSAALASDALFATVLALVVTSSLFTGLVVFFAGVLRLGALIRYIPYPVIAGFLASTGYLLLMGGLGIVAQESVSIFNLAEVLGTLSLARWLPWILGGLALAIAAQRMPGDLLVPSALCVATAMFFAVLTLQGLTMNEALSTGLLLGPFEQARLGDTLTRDVARDIDWSLILMAAPTLLAIAGLTLLGSLLNTTGLAITLDQPSDTEQDMRATGLSNIAAAFAGGPPGYVILGESILAHRMGLRGIAPGLVAAAACAGAVIAGTDILAYIPAGLMAMLVSYLGFDLLDTWLWQSRRRLTRFEYGVVLLIFAIAATLGFLQALAIGTLAAAGIFIVSYARTEVVRSRSTLATRRSRVERPEEELALLARAGEHCVILELSGHLFFGTADRFAKLLKGEIESDAALHHLI